MVSDAVEQHSSNRSALAICIAVSAFVGFSATAIWAAAGAGYYWPAWVWLAGVIATSIAYVGFHWRMQEPGQRRWFNAQVDVLGAISLWLILVWAFTGAGTFWPIWAIVSFGVILGANAIGMHFDRLPLIGRNKLLQQRVETLTRTRLDALDLQATELRRIERDLHDGAQARLVALSMQLGRAETRLANDPEAAALVRSARDEASAAIAELRDLVRGIAPPILMDRGLVAAVNSLADRSPVPVSVTAHGLDRLPAVVEIAAYFIVAESMTNAAKHAPGSRTRVTLEQREAALVIDVVDDGPGGADPAGAGLTGLRQRAEALDGTLTVVSPPGGPTVIHAELPCR